MELTLPGREADQSRISNAQVQECVSASVAGIYLIGVNGAHLRFFLPYKKHSYVL
jgi:hypothetical protein